MIIQFPLFNSSNCFIHRPMWQILTFTLIFLYFFPFQVVPNSSSSIFCFSLVYLVVQLFGVLIRSVYPVSINMFLYFLIVLNSRAFFFNAPISAFRIKLLFTFSVESLSCWVFILQRLNWIIIICWH